MYFATPSTEPVVAAMRDGLLGAINTPEQGTAGRRIVDLPHWCADNGCGPGKRGIGTGYPGDEQYLAWLTSLQPHADRCWFAVAPDVVGDAAATLERSAPFLPAIRALGYPAAFAAQNGLDRLVVPWDDFGVLFIGGDDDWKLGGPVRRLVAQANARGKPVHMGRVNSLQRLKYADAIGCASADGTHLTYEPRVALPEILGWLRAVNDQGVLFAELTS